MSVKIRISYERPEELQKLMEKLGKDIKVKAPRQQEGKFHKVYIELNENLEKTKLSDKMIL